MSDNSGIDNMQILRLASSFARQSYLKPYLNLNPYLIYFDSLFNIDL